MSHAADCESVAITPGAGDDRLWPGVGYQRQVERLRGAIGETVYLVELIEGVGQLGAHLSDRPYELLAVLDFPRPDPARGLTPHLVLLDDGRGLNLGRVARISRRPFAPSTTDLLYLDTAAERRVLFAERRLSVEFIAERSHQVLGQALGCVPATGGDALDASIETALEPEPLARLQTSD
ncbi:hypothetical protein MARPU_08060 [Marichromatium purpuratum 984]|uniref:Uncharacterized protein n=1 Tax=Marichromatium purpuratum 984 TaxID=765910 RepID=W0DZF3_MARPU|nr:hypothetical protein [Marichromatium purpuratum]AHF03827.1 hypothetical protein MARPU_08060 [Marichromatium purpuratum 984]